MCCVILLRNKLKQLWASSFLRSVMVVASGTAGAQLLTVAFSPVITRLYGPEAFGVLGTFIAILAVLAPVAALTYPVAMVLPKKDGDARVIATLSFYISIAMSVVFGGLFFVFWEAGGQVFDLDELSSLVFLISVALLFSGLQQTFTQWLIRKREYRRTARAAVVQAFIANSSKVGVGLISPTGTALVAVTAFAHGLYALLLYLATRGSGGGGAINKQASFKEILHLAKRYYDFPLYRAPQALLNAASQSLPVIMLAVYFGTAAAGYMALTKAILAAPAALVGTSVGNVFYPKAVELKQSPDKLLRFLSRATWALFFIGLGLFMSVIIFGPTLFGFFFGVEWKPAGEYARWVSIWMVFSLAGRPLLSVVPVIEAQKLLLIYECVFLPVKFSSVFVGVLYENALLSVAMYSVVSCSFYLLLYFVVRRRLQSD